MPLNYSFAGKKVLVTGGGQGIGRELVQVFHDDGAIVFTLDKNPETIQKLRDELPNVRAEIVDLTDWDATRKVVESFGPIDHLVNNAAVFVAEKFMEITQNSCSQQFDVNIGAAIIVTQTVAKKLIEDGREGTVVNISSIGGRMGNTVGGGVYCVTKSGLENLTKTMALELGAHGIRVNCVLPGIVNAPMRKAVPEIEECIKREVLPRMVIKRLVEPKEVADAVMFLSSPLSAMIVGEAVVVDGGNLTT